MPEAPGPAALPVWRRLLQRRRYRVLVVLVLLAVALRAALPAIVRRVAVSQADQALVGRIEIDDVDFALLTGGVTLHGLRVFATEAAVPAAVESAAVPAAVESAAAPAAVESAAAPAAVESAAAPAAVESAAVPAAVESAAAPAAVESPADAASPPRAGEGPPGSAPVFSADHLTVDLGFRALLRKTVEVQRIEIVGAAVSLDRAKDGTLVLPAAAASDDPAPAPAAEGPGWGVLIQSVALRDGRIGFRDFAVGDPPQRVEVALPALDAGQLALLITESGIEPGKVSLDAGIQDGTLHLDATLESLAAGPAYESHVVLTNVPIADSRLYIPKVGWSGLVGRLDADLVHRFESQGAHTVRGKVGLRDLDVRVADLDGPALAWRALTLDVTGIDFVAQHADVATITLDGARVLTRPAGPAPLPVLQGLFAAASEQVAAVQASPAPVATAAATAPTPAATAITSPDPSVSAAPDAAVPPSEPSVTVDAASTKPWTWAIGKATVNDGTVQAIGGDGPLEVTVTAAAGPLVSAAGKPMAVRLALGSSAGGTLEAAGDLTLTPLAFAGTLGAKDLRLAPLTLPVATAATRLLRGGVANLDLAVAVGATPDAPPDGVHVAGTLALDDLDVAGEDPAAFALRWQKLAVALASLTVPGVLAPGGAVASAGIDAAFTSINLVRPELTMTRTADGIVLPSALGGAPVPKGDAATPRPAPTPAASVGGAAPAAPAPRPEFRGRAERFTLEKMSLVVNDTAVKPFFRSTLDPIDFGAADVAWPGPSANDVKLVAKSADGAVLTVTGNVAPERTRLVCKLAGLPLAPFNPYVASTGYGVAGGTAQLESTVTLGPRAYDTKSRLVFNRLDVRSGEGDALFTSHFGMPLSLALSLLTDLQGNIVLDLPIAGDASGMRTGLGTLVGNALARAILNAVTSPLKLIGAVAHIGDKPASLTPQPIAFLAGRAAMADGEEQKLAPLASLLAKAPGLRLHLRGEAGDVDRRWLREQALRAKLEQESRGFGAVRHVAERGVRQAVLAALTARAAGTSAEVPAEHQTWFETEVAAQNIDDGALRELAVARATAVQTKLASGQGVAAERVVLDEPAATNPAASPAVAVGLGSPPPPSPK